MKINTINPIKVVILVAVLVLTTLACGIFGGAAPAPTKVVVKQATLAPVPEATATPEAAVAPTDVPVNTEVAATDVPAASPTEAPTEGSSQMTESWRIAPYPGATLLVYDKTPNIDPSWTAVVEKQARNLAIPKPYYFEFYNLPAGTKFTELKAYYDKAITSLGMKRAMDDMDNTGIAVVTWTNPAVKTQKYLLQYNPATATHQAITFIIYSNPQ